MDILRKMFNIKTEKEDSTSASDKDEFRKPQWFEESETDDELFDDDRKFAFQIFTNPLELQKHFERQMQHILESINQLDDNGVPVEKNLKEEFLKPGFEESFLKQYEEHKKNLVDTDLDGEIYADQLHSLMQRLPAPEDSTILPRNDTKALRPIKSKEKLTDEETILGKIHGTIVEEDTRSPRFPRPRPDMMTPMGPMIPRGHTPFGGVFEGTYQGPKLFSQSVVTKTVRKPDGSYETTKIVTDSQGNKTTTVTRTINGKSETITTYDGAKGARSIKQRDNGKTEFNTYSDRNIYVSKEGYAVPRNLW